MRVSPVNPIDQVLPPFTAFQNPGSEATIALRASIEDLYGLQGSIFEQYIAFWKRILGAATKAVFHLFPHEHNDIIRKSIGWTIGLLGTCAGHRHRLLGLILGTLCQLLPQSLVVKAENSLTSIQFRTTS